MIVFFRFPIQQLWNLMIGMYHHKSPTHQHRSLKIGWTKKKIWFQVKRKFHHYLIQLINSNFFRLRSREAKRLGRGNGWHLGSSIDQESTLRGQWLWKMGACVDCQSRVQRKVACTVVRQSKLSRQMGSAQHCQSRLLRRQQSIHKLNSDCELKGFVKLQEALVMRCLISVCGWTRVMVNEQRHSLW